MIGPTVQLCQDMNMTTPASRNPRRSDALSRKRIVEATVEVLDATGEAGLTVRLPVSRIAH